jgi:hypothetical protein
MKVFSRFAAVLVTAAVAIGFSATSALGQQDGTPSPAGPSVQAITSTGPAGAPKVLILDTTVSGGTSSLEAQAALSLGFAVDVADATSWASLTASDFSSYRAIVLGDNHCTSISSYAAALANASTWAPTINGNVVAIGTDPVFHSGSEPGAVTLINKAMAFATGQAGKTGYYADMSCILPTGGDPAQILDPVESGWTVNDTTGALDSVHVVATNPFLSGLTDTALSNWGNSVHEAFSAWPADFVPIAIVTDATPPLSYTAPDGVQGDPYILGRGAGLVAGAISLTGNPASLDVGGTATLTALVQPSGTPLAGATVTFTATSGPNAGMTGTGVTDSSGNATFTYSSAIAGTDTWSASFTPVGAAAQTSNDVTIEWIGATPTVPAPVVIAPKFTG